MNWEVIESQNPWWADPTAIERDEKVSEALSKKHCFIPPYDKGNYLIFGPRQTGKTTYLRLCIRQLISQGVDPARCLYFVCNLAMGPQDILDVVSLFSKIPGEKYVFLDEVSFVPGWERAIKHILEIESLRKGMNFYFTGSSTLELQKERFPGRPIKTKELLPLTFRDFCSLFGKPRLREALGEAKLSKLEQTQNVASHLLPYVRELSELFEQYIHCGGFLRSAYELMEGAGIREETYEIYWNWVAGDITKLNLSERTLSAILKGVIKRYATSFSLSSLAKEIEIPSHVTVREYLEILESLYVLRSYWKGYDTSPVFRKERKAYFTDSFLYHVAACKTLGLKEETAAEKPKVVEGIVGEALRRAGYEVRFLRNRKEIDFICGKVGIEVKWQEKTSAKDFPSADLKSRILLSKQDVEFGDVTVIPVPLFLALIV